MSPFKEAIDRRNIDAGISLLAPDVVFRSPVLRKPFRGRNEVAPILNALWTTWQDFRYVDVLGSFDSQKEALVFRARMLDQDAEGITLLTWNASLISEFTVMVRPFRAARAILEAFNLDPERA